MSTRRSQLKYLRDLIFSQENGVKVQQNSNLHSLNIQVGAESVSLVAFEIGLSVS